MHWADLETLTVCDYLADHCAGTAISVVATGRLGEGTNGLARLIDRARDVVLKPLDAGQVAEMAGACLGAVPSAAILTLLDRARAGCRC
jgi:hypothetical protein